MEWLNFHRLRYFLTVARKGSVRKAGEELQVSQASISVQLRFPRNRSFAHLGQSIDVSRDLVRRLTLRIIGGHVVVPAHF